MLILLLKRLLLVFISSSIFVVKISAQQNASLSAKKQVQKDFKEYISKHDRKAHIMHHKILNAALKHNFIKYELGAYRKLAVDHAVEDMGKRNFDSILYYFDKYETRLVDIDTSKPESKKLFSEICSYYISKAEILENEFGFNESGERALIKAAPYLEGNKMNKLVWYSLKLSTLFFNKENYDKSLAIVSKFLKDTAKIKPSRKKSIYDRMASIYIKKKEYDKAYEFYYKSLQIALKSKKEDKIWSTKTKFNEACFFYKDQQKAIKNALEIREHYKEAKIGKRLKGLNRVLIQLANFYYWTGDVDKAITYRKEAIKTNISNSVLTNHYEKLAEYFMVKNEFKSVIKYYQKRDEIKQKIHKTDKMLLIKYSDANLKLAQQKQINRDVLHQNQLLEANNKKQKLYLIIGSVFIAILILLTVLLYLYIQYRKTHANLEELKVSEKQLLEEQIKLRENELEASTMAVTQRAKVLNVIKNDLDNIEENNPKIEKLKKTVQNLINSASDLNIITNTMKSKYAKLSLILKDSFPDLTQNELRYCLLSKLDLTLKETAVLLNVAPNTVKVSRSRIKKKMNIPTELSLQEYLNQY